jgi:NTE family protein
MRIFRRKKKIGLALGGGAVLGAAHIGVLKAIEEFNIPISYIAGTSIGAIISAFYAFGKNWEEMAILLKGLNWLDISRISLSQFGLLSNKKLGKLITDNLGDVSFDEACIPLAMIATDITSGEKVVLKSGNVAAAVMASSCIPGIFIPVEIDNRLLVDGELVENVPISPLKDMGANFIISVDLFSGLGSAFSYGPCIFSPPLPRFCYLLHSLSHLPLNVPGP